MNSKKFNVFLNSKIRPYNKTIQVTLTNLYLTRSFLIGSISQKVSKVKNILESEDVRSTIDACKKLGIKIEK